MEERPAYTVALIRKFLDGPLVAHPVASSADGGTTKNDSLLQNTSSRKWAIRIVKEGKRMSSYVLGFQDIDKTKIMVVGGKGANLGEISKVEGIRVPDGFCISTEAFKRIIGETSI